MRQARVAAELYSKLSKLTCTASHLIAIRGHMKLTVHENWIEGDGVRFKGEYPVLSASLINEHVLVIYDWMAFERNSPARNLFCYARAGSFIWRASDISQGTVDAYTYITSESPLWVGNFSGFNCRVDEASGNVLETYFNK